MKRRMLILISLAMSTAMLGACTGNEGGSRGTYEPGEVDGPSVAETPTPTIEVPTPEPDIVAKLPIFRNEFANGDVEGNGGYFIRLGRKVYYRVIAPEGMPDSAIFGDYLVYEDPSVPSTIAVYDLDNETWEDVMQVNGSGEIFACTDGILLPNGNGDIMLYDTEAETEWRLCGGDSVIDVSDDGRVVAVSGHDKDWNITYSVYIDGKLAHTVYGVSEAYGFVGDDLIAMRHEDDGTYRMISYSIAGFETTLGSFTKPDDLYDAWAMPELIEFEAVNGMAYITYGYYEGSGHFLNMWEAYKMQPGVENSLEGDIANAENNMVSVDNEPRMLIDTDGEVYFYDVKSNSLGLSDGYTGNLVYYDSPFGAQILDKYTITGYSDQEWLEDILVSAVLDNTAFYIKAAGRHIREDDIGWRYSYSPSEYMYYAIPFGAGVERNDEGVPVNKYDLCFEFPYHVDKEEDPEKLKGTDWVCYSYSIEGNFELAENDVYERYLHFNDDGTITLSQTYIPEKKKEEYTLIPEELDFYDHFPCYALDEKDTGHEDWAMISLIGDHMEFSVEWKYSDGTPGGCTYVFNPVE